MEELDKKIKLHLIGKEITGIEIFNINDNYYVFNPESLWAFDGGIQISFGETFLSWGWNYETEIFEFSTEKKTIELLGNANFYQVDPTQILKIHELKGSRIKDVKIKWEFYQDINEDFEPIGERIYTPVNIILIFESKSFLQMATLNFMISGKPFKIINAQYDLAGKMLFSINDEITVDENQQ